MSKKLLYTYALDGGIVFATVEDAAYVHKLHCALDSDTWGEFRSAMPAAEYERIMRTDFDEQGEPRPRDDEPFPGEVAGSSQGDWPPWLQQEMADVVPLDLLHRFGVLESSVLNGSFWHIPKDNLSAICDELRALGWEVEEADTSLRFY